MRKKTALSKSRVFRLREWLTVPEAARHLSNVFDEEVGEADVLRFALDGNLKLSVYFVNYAKAKCGKLVKREDVEKYPLDTITKRPGYPVDEKGNPISRGLMIDEDRYLILSKEVTTIKGVWDLPMFGGESLDVENRYQQLTDGPEVTLTCLEGLLVEQEGVMCELQESMDENEFQSGSLAQLEKIKEKISNSNMESEKANQLLSQHKKDREKYLVDREMKNPSADYYPAGGLPSDSVFVVRNQALIDLQEKFSQQKKSEKNILDDRSEKTYLKIIGALLECITGTFKDHKFTSETQLREFISEKFDDLYGVRARTLAGKFSLAKKTIKNDID